jgi:predicted MPP superfamily phosphohydrolase
MQAAFTKAGWLDLTNTRATLDVPGHGTLKFVGVDDAHVRRDRYPAPPQSEDENGEGHGHAYGGDERPRDDSPATEASDALTIGVTHAPYLRVLDAMTADGVPLILAGHTHGGQLCVPFYGALVTNCDLDRARAKGLHTHTAGGHTAHLHVSAGCGASRYAPVRFACPPEASLITLLPRVS